MKKTNFNQNWELYNLEEGANPFAPPQVPKKIHLPYDAMIQRARDPQTPDGATTGYFPSGNVKYEKHFQGNAASTILEIEGVYSNAFIYLNGNFCGKCPSGYRDYYVDLTPYIRIGEDNLLSIETRSGMGKNSRWYSGDGIYRNVYLYEAEDAYILPNSLKMNTLGIPSEDTTDAFLELSGQCIAAKTEDTIQIQMGNTIVSECKISSDGSFYSKFTLKNAKLWSDEHPNLYPVTVTLVRNATAIDQEHFSYGIRTIELIPQKGLYINHEEVLLRGGCIHHDNGLLGANEYDDSAYRRVKILKEAGFNAIRMAHNPCSKALLKACDELGMYIMDESFDTWNVSKSPYDYAMYFEENWKDDLLSMVEKDYNHPSVILYSIGNEIKELNTKQGVEKNRELYQFVKNLDSSRPVLNAINGMFTAMQHLGDIMQDLNSNSGNNMAMEINNVMTVLDTHMDDIMRHRYVTEMLDPICDSLDLAGYNYMGGRYEEDVKNYPERIIVGSETRPDSIAVNWEKVKALPNVIGDFVWAAWDYLGEAGVGRVDFEEVPGPMYGNFPWMSALSGDIDICGRRRVQSYYREIVWKKRTAPYIAVWNPEHYGMKAHTSNWSWSEALHSWTWPGYEGKPIRVDVYSSADEIELFLGNTSLGKKKLTDYKCEFDITYEKKPLKAISYIDGNVQSQDLLLPAEGDFHIDVLQNKERLRGNGKDLMYLDITVCDSNGNFNPYDDRNMQINIDGPAKLLAFANANPKNTASFQSDETKLYLGKAQAILWNPEDTAESTITLSGDGLADLTITI
jgi:beta-galactosidase